MKRHFVDPRGLWCCEVCNLGSKRWRGKDCVDWNYEKLHLTRKTCGRRKAVPVLDKGDAHFVKSVILLSPEVNETGVEIYV